jgi:tripartite-type tricarboxylate transporter receptor subunit TctC
MSKSSLVLGQSTAIRLALAAFVVVAGALNGVAPAAAQPYPAKPIKIISPFSPGSPPDALGRLVGQRLAERFGQSVTIENRPGGGTTIATKAATTADSDGYTLLQTNATLAYASVLYPNAGYDPLKSFSPVATFATWSLLLVVPAGVPASTVQELIAYAKANPGQTNIGFPLGSPPQVLAEMFKTASGAPFNSIPYRQVSQLMSDLLSGRVHAFFGAGAALVSLVQQGKLKALAYTGVTRYSGLPAVPTVVESGFPELALNPVDWTGLLAPTGTSLAVVDTLNAAVSEILMSPDVRRNIAQHGGEIKISSSSEFATFLAAETKKWPPLVKRAGLQPN